MTPFIIYSKRSIEEIRGCVLNNYGSIKYELPFIRALCVDVPHKNIPKIRNHRRVAMVARDVEVSKIPAFPINSAPVPGSAARPGSAAIPDSATALPAISGLFSSGSGVSIAVIDTGIFPHDDLVKPNNRILVFKDYINDRMIPYDDDGHGTHVSGIALGNGFVSGKYSGTAPRANLIALKALDAEGNGITSDILAAMQWVADNCLRHNIRVVNLSLGITPAPEVPLDPLVKGANALVDLGLSVVAAAGNGGPSPRTVTSPGISSKVITVGACHNLSVPEFSSRGPAPSGIVKPDIVAPGVDVISLSAESSRGYLYQSGTSMSCPYVSGIVASIYSRYPKLTPAKIKKILRQNALYLESSPHDSQGYGAVL